MATGRFPSVSYILPLFPKPSTGNGKSSETRVKTLKKIGRYQSPRDRHKSKCPGLFHSFLVCEGGWRGNYRGKHKGNPRGKHGIARCRQGFRCPTGFSARFSAGFYAGRTVGCDRHHRHARGAAPPGRAGGQGICPPEQLPKHTQAVGAGHAQPRRCEEEISARDDKHPPHVLGAVHLGLYRVSRAGDKLRSQVGFLGEREQRCEAGEGAALLLPERPAKCDVDRRRLHPGSRQLRGQLGDCHPVCERVRHAGRQRAVSEHGGGHSSPVSFERHHRRHVEDAPDVGDHCLQGGWRQHDTGRHHQR